MHNEHYVWLGSRRAIKRDTGNKAALLDKGAHVRLPVPAGIVLLDDAWRIALSEGYVSVFNQRVIIEDAAAIGNFLLEATFTRPVAVRSAFSAEDSADKSYAGHFETRLNIDPGDDPQISAALAAVWSSALAYDAPDGPMRRDVLIMEMVDAQVAGVAFTQQAFEDDLINYTSGLGDKLVAGEVAGERIEAAKLKAGESPAASTDPFVVRLQRLLRGVRTTYGKGDWDIEWADDGNVCWLLQVRPITAAPRRNEAFTYANIKEIMPDPPSTLMSDVVAACSDGLFAYYRKFDAGLPNDRPMIEMFAGRPLFNITLLTDMMRKWGLPTKLVTNSIGGSANVDVGFNLRRFLGHTFVLLRQGWDQLTAVSQARRASRAFIAATARPPANFTTASYALTDLFTELVTRMFGLTAAMSGPLLLLRLSGTLTQHNARHQSISTAMYTDLAPLQELVAQNPSWHDVLATGQAPDDPAFQAAWQTYLDKHGRRGIYESDIARPRYHEAPEPLLRSLTAPRRAPAPLPKRTTIGRLTLPIWRYLSGILSAREQFRYDAMIGYDNVRRHLLQLAEQATAQGQLPERDSIFQLHLDELRALDDGATYDAAFFVERAAEIETLKQYDVPDMLYRFDDLTQFNAAAQAELASGARLQGVSLTDGLVDGQAWVLDEPSMALPAGFSPSNTILVARSVDAGWIPTFSQVAGVVVEIGGDLSHGSIILRELGLPAITNVTGATRQIPAGASLRLQAGQGAVTLK